jgi:hypothetical protein
MESASFFQTAPNFMVRLSKWATVSITTLMVQSTEEIGRMTNVRVSVKCSWLMVIPTKEIGRMT